MNIENDPLISLVSYLLYLLTYIIYLFASILYKILFFTNIILSLVSAIECLWIVGLLTEMMVRESSCRCLDVKKLLGVWKTILMAISLYALREGYSVLDSSGVVRIIYGYEIL